MPGTTVGNKLDLSKLTDEEAKHVWEVIQRDFDLRKKEEDRLGDLKTKIEREDTKRELLGNKSSLAESHCIRCLQPFLFLVNSKRQCLDCQMYTCKSCSRYNKKEQGWVCDPCRMARVFKIGTLEWYHENVRARFKRFGSAKVMRSLFKRLNGEHSSSQNNLTEPLEFDTRSMPEVPTDDYEEHNMDSTDAQHDKGMKKTKRRLTVDPFDLDLDRDYAIDSRRQSYQVPNSHVITEGSMRESMTAEADMASVYHQILEDCQRDDEPEFNTEVGLNRRMSQGMASRHEDSGFSDHRPTLRRSLSRHSHSSCGSSSAGGARRRSSYLPGPDDSGEDEDECLHYPLYQSHRQRAYSHTSQESLNSVASTPQITELNRRMSAIETILNRLEQKVISPLDQAPQTPASTSPFPQWEDVDLEEQQLRQKLDEMTGNISDHGLTSDEDESKAPSSPQKILPWRNPEREANTTKLPSRPTSRTDMLVSTPIEKQGGETESQKASCSPESLERKWHPLEEGSKASFKGSTALLFELEDKVAQAAANVQNAQSEVSYIEDRIAALSAAGMTVDKSRRSAIPVRSRRLSHDFPTSQVDRFVRNSLYRGSLTQRNPVVKPKTRATCAKPVMAQAP
ncbi:melanophilin [Myripristis murdjan]|uniref:melanophilin n=1 Tax=Myripristis murdjan TaxID=586833 RepID=UPI0011764678|nr:melanophilin [Myripristis murdjan]